MTQDTCGAETTGDQPCQNPTTQDNNPNRCWIPSHNDPDADNPHGREWTISQDDHSDILQAAREGLSKSGCARAAGVDEKNLRRYLKQHPDFRRSFAQAREQGERELIRGGLRDPDMDSSMAKFLLSTSFEYVKTEKRELEHSGDAGIVIHTEALDNASDE